MTTPITRLRTWAEQALADYTADMQAGGEPVYPQLAEDVLVLIAEVEQLKNERLSA